MSLIKREPTPALASANRANSLLSTGPRSERGKEISSRNLPKSRPFSEATLCPRGANAPKAVSLLKTKDQKRQYSSAKAVNKLKKRQLSRIWKSGFWVTICPVTPRVVRGGKSSSLAPNLAFHFQ
jgi:hypothetical protein